MTSREVILANLGRGNAPRTGFNFGGGRRNDFCGRGIGPSKTWQPRRWTEGDFEYYDDQWGKSGASGPTTRSWPRGPSSESAGLATRRPDDARLPFAS